MARAGCDDAGRVGGVDADGEGVHPAELLEQHRFASITGKAASGPMLPRPSTAVPLETTATMLPLKV